MSEEVVVSTSLTLFETIFLGCIGLVGFVLVLSLFWYWLSEWSQIRREKV